MSGALTKRWLLAVALAATVAALAACTSDSATATPTETEPTLTPTTAPEPTETATPSPTAAPTATPSAMPTDLPVTLTPTPASTPSPESSVTPETGALNISTDSVIDFPNSINFSLEADSEIPVENVELWFNFPLAHTCVSSFYNSVRIEPEDANDVEASWEWSMQEQGSIPPGTVITYHWRITDEDGGVFTTESEVVTWDDARFSWSEYQDGNVTYRWYDGGSNYGETLASLVETRLDRMELGATLDKPILAYIYPDAATLRGAILYTQAWTGGLAFTSQNILLIAVNPSDTEGQVDGLVHELGHLLVREVTFSCLGDMPNWLDEGLAEYAEGQVTSAEQTRLEVALAAGDLITLQSLNSSFPADHSGATLAYTQSKSIVTYLISVHGWEKMNQLLDIFEEGSAYESAVRQVYDMDLLALDTAWRAWLPSQ